MDEQKAEELRNQKEKGAPIDWRALSPILFMMALGVGVAAAPILTFQQLCTVYPTPRPAVSALNAPASPRERTLCSIAAQNPPWLALTSLMSAPSILLTWYWRTKYRKQELSQKHVELRQKDREHERLLADAARQRKDGLRTEIRQAAQRALGIPADGATALVTLERMKALEPELAQDVADAVAFFLRGSTGDLEAGPSADPNATRHRQNRNRALNLLSDLRTQREVQIDLRFAEFDRMILDELDLRDADLEGASFESAELRAVDLRGAKLNGVRARNATYAKEVKWEAKGEIAFQAGGGGRVRTEEEYDELKRRREAAKRHAKETPDE